MVFELVDEVWLTGGQTGPDEEEVLKLAELILVVLGVGVDDDMLDWVGFDVALEPVVFDAVLAAGEDEDDFVVEDVDDDFPGHCGAGGRGNFEGNDQPRSATG